MAVDRPKVAALSREMLEGLGYTVHVAGSAKKALDLQRQHQNDWTSDLLFSDLIMPGDMNGFGLAQEMCKRLPHVRILLTTGYARSSDGVNKSEGSEFEILKKPYRLSDLTRRVRRVLDTDTSRYLG